MNYDILDHLSTQQKLLAAGESFAVVTLAAIRGSAPQVVGAKAIVAADGIRAGTVGGGKVEAAAIEHAQKLLREKSVAAQLVVWNLQTDIGMTCGGEVKLLFETHAEDIWPIVVFGAGHVAQALIRLLVQLNCSVTCVDTRAQWLERLPAHPRLRTVLAEIPKEQVAAQPENAFFVLMSKGHATDLPVLAEILVHRQPPYVGVIGSPQKASVLRRDLATLGLNSEQISGFRCPMGLPIGNNTPIEIAISIVAQLLEVRDALAAAKDQLQSKPST